MKIAFIGGRDIHKLGGIESYMFNLATELVKLGHEPIVFCESDHNGTEICNGFRVIHQKSVGGRYLCKIILGYKSTLMMLLGREKIDIYHYNAAGPALASWLPRLFGKTSILQGHGLEWKRTKYNGFQQIFVKWIAIIALKMNKFVTMVSKEQSDYYLKNNNKKCTTIPTATFMPKSIIKSDILSKYNIPENKYFLYLGRLVQDKNPDYLIKAFIKADLKDQYLVIAGDNKSMPNYVEKLHKLAEGNEHIIFTGAVYGDDKEKLLQKCFAFCIPSTIEGLAITLLEAMSYGKICIASSIPANKEGLGDSGVWCRYEDVKDLSDKLIYTVKNYNSIQWQEKYNMERVRKYFTWQAVSKKYSDYILSLGK